MIKIRPVILCGGTGTRLWPISRKDYPKQFVEFPVNKKDNSLFKYAINRIDIVDKRIKICEPIVIACNNYRYYVKDQLNDEGSNAEVFLEPIGRNTAPALTMAALWQQSEDPILVVLPSDQAIDDIKLNEAIKHAIPSCEAGDIVLLGIKPNYPETGYGYIKTQHIPSDEHPIKVDCFVEKPNFEKARLYIDEGNYLWNSGIFIVKASVWLKALHYCRSDIETLARNAWSNRVQLSSHEITVDLHSYLQIPSESVDFAVLEKCKKYGIPLKVISFSGKWTDLGAWNSVFDAVPKDSYGNFITEKVLTNKTTNSMIVSTSRLVVANGISNLAIIETNDAVLVTSFNHCQQVKDIVTELKKEGCLLATEHRKGRRPWGWYEVIDEGDGFKVKRIVVKPGECLSLQRHQKRTEHWVVVSGEALVEVDGQKKIVKTNESVFIAQYSIHRLTNNSSEPLIIIEVQTGDYFGEDDIERLDDRYARL